MPGVEERPDLGKGQLYISFPDQHLPDLPEELLPAAPDRVPGDNPGRAAHQGEQEQEPDTAAQVQVVAQVVQEAAGAQGDQEAPAKAGGVEGSLC